ncbi:MAG: DUF6600 domain-containing protein [Rhodanobacteraceae bacterium]
MMNLLNRLSSLTLICLLLALPVMSQAQDIDLPDRVARLSFVRGDVSMAPGGSDNWNVADRNRPLLRGDRLYIGDGSRAVLEMGDASLRMDDRSAVDLVALNDERAQVQLTQGTVNLSVHRLDRDQIYEIDTPTMAFVADQPGSYRIDVDPDGYGAMVTVFSGQGTVWGDRNSSYRVYSGRSFRFDSSDVQRVRISSIPSYNDFDRFCADLDSGYASSVSSRYVAQNVVGYRDLDRYGTWRSSAEYGHVWFPSQVNTDWAPYRDGRWTWIEPWGWTWVDNAPWGFAPFHYGRWARVHNRWGWVPGPRLRRAVYAPALVAFVGNVSISIGGGTPVGWFPLGPRDIYQPPYRVNQDYFVNINLGGGRFFNRNHVRDRWDDYHQQRNYDRFTYAYRHDRDAVTVVSSDHFRDSRIVNRSTARMSEAVLLQSRVERAPSVQPNRASAGAGRAQPKNQVFARKVVSRAPVSSQGVTRTGVISSPRGTPQRSAAGSTSPPRNEMFRTPVRTPVGNQRTQSPPVPRTTVPRSTLPQQRNTSPRGLPSGRTVVPNRPIIDAGRSPGSLPVSGSQPSIRQPGSIQRSRPTSPSRSLPRAQPPVIAPQRTPAIGVPRNLPQPVRRSTPQPGSGVSNNSSVRSTVPVSKPVKSGNDSKQGQSASPRGKPQRRAASGIR